jgi:hypothetical protein
MTVGELRQQLEQYPDTMQVFMAERKTEFSYGLLNSVSKRKINFSEDPDSKPLAKEEVLILDEE